MEASKVEKIWSGVGKFAVVVAILLAVIQIFVLVFTVNEYEVKAYGERAAFDFPDVLTSALDDFERTITTDSLESSLKTLEDDREFYGSRAFITDSLDREHYRSRAARAIEGHVWDAYPHDLISDLERVRSIWSFDIENTGEKELSNLNLELPFDGFYSIRRSGKPPIIDHFDKNIPIGSLRPSNKVSIVVWSGLGGQTYESDTRITHSNGVARIAYPRKVRGLLAWISRNALWITWLIPLLIGLVVVSIYDWGSYYFERKKKVTRKKNEESSNEPEGSA